VDLVARATVALGRLPKAAGQTFHLCGDGPLLSDVIREMRKKGHQVEDVGSEQWKRMVDDLEAKPHRPTDLIKSMLRDVDFEGSARVVPTENTRRILEEVGVEWPEITTAVIGLGIDYLGEKNVFYVQKKD